MSIFGAGTNDFANLTGLDEGEYASFNDIEVAGNIYLKQPDEDTGFNSVLITNQENISGINNENNIVNNLTGFNDNWIITLGTGQDSFEEVLKINPQTGFNFDATGGTYNISWNELSYLNNVSSNIQDQINGITTGVARWGAFWSTSTQTNPTANSVNLVSYSNSDPSNNAVSYNNSNRIQVTNAGVYLVVASFQLNKSSGSTDEEIYFWLRKNGTDISASGYKEFIKATPKILTASWILPLSANDYIQIAWFSPDIHAELKFIPAGTGTPVYPSSPSVLASVNQISTYNSTGGTGSNPVLNELTYNSTNDTIYSSANFDTLTNNLITTNLNSANITNTNNITTGSLSVSGALNTGTLSVSSGVVGTLNVNTSANMNNGLNVYGTSDLSGNIIAGRLNAGYTTEMRNNLVNRGDGNAIYASSGNIATQGLLYCDCGSVGGVTYGFYDVIDFVKQRDQIVYDKALEGVNKAENAQDTADTAKSTADAGVALATTANALALATAGALGVITATTIPTIQGQIGTLQGQMSAEQSKTQNLLPTSLGGGTKCSGNVNVYSSLDPITAQVQLNPSGQSSFNGGIACGSVLDANEIQTDVIYSNNITNSGNLITGTINTGSSGTQNVDGGWINIGHLGSIITIGGVLYSPFNNPATYWTQWV